MQTADSLVVEDWLAAGKNLVAPLMTEARYQLARLE
jgi:hypothetical protein